MKIDWLYSLSVKVFIDLSNYNNIKDIIMRTYRLTIAKISIVTAMWVLLSWISQQQTFANEPDRDGDGISNVAEQILGTNPDRIDTDGDGESDVKDKEPVFCANPIHNTATNPGFKIVEALVENNVDPLTKKDASDHLELTLKNTAQQDLSNFELYYSILDEKTKKREGYYVKLPNLVIKQGKTETIHFDSISGPGHILENINSIYRTNPNAKIFTVMISTNGFRAETVTINKDEGGAEEAD